MKTKLFFLKTITPLHCGIGQGLSDIDLPTARDAVSGHPYVPGSSIKGVLRDALSGGADKNLLTAAFGAEGSDCVDSASSAAITDARLICLPVRSFFGTFAWVASPYTLNMFRGLAERAGLTGIPALPVFNPGAREHYHCTAPEASRVVQDKAALLEDLDLTTEANMAAAAGEWADFISGAVFGAEDPQGCAFFRERFLIVDDNVLNFLCETALPVQAHIRIDGETGTVARGALWYMETVPSECIMAGLVMADAGRGKHRNFTPDDIMKFVAGDTRHLQIGGNASTGCGMATLRFSGAAN